MWVGILDKSCKKPIEKKGCVLGFFVLETKQDIEIKHEAAQAKKKVRRTAYQKRQRGVFLNCYDFAYAGRDVVNQAAKVEPGLIKNVSNKINNMAQQRINQIISRGQKEVERVLPKLPRGATEDVYQTSFRLLGKFGKEELNKLKKKILR